jgi:hypothetical protein
MGFSKQKQITVTAEDFIDRNAVRYAEFTDRDGRCCLVQTIPDEDCENPRRMADMLWTWVTTRNAGYSDRNETPEDYEDDEGRIDRRFCRANLVCPLYLYRHGGDVISTGGLGDLWDSGCMGFAYLSREKIQEEYGWKRLTRKRIERLHKYLEGEVQEMNAWLSGYVYGVKVTNLETEYEDSCWGFIDTDGYLEEAVRGMLYGWVDRHEEREKIARTVV